MTRRKCRTWQPNEITSIIRSSQDEEILDARRVSFGESEGLALSQSFNSDISYLRRNVGSQPSTSSQEGSVSSARSEKTSPEDHGPAAARKARGIEAPIKILPASMQKAQAPLANQHQALSEGHPPLTADGEHVGASDRQASHRISSHAEHALNQNRNTGSTSSNTPPPGFDSLNLAKHASVSTAPSCNTSKTIGSVSRSKSSGLKRTASLARLSTSLDGKAQVVLGNNSPSPFKKRTVGLQRSQSAIQPTTDVPYQLGVDIAQSLKIQSHGRSRDASAWEFYCDSDARNALTKTAELDKHGSAEGVLGLIRSSAGQRKPLGPLRKENVPLHRADELLGKASKARMSRSSKLGRAMTTMGRLQGSSKRDVQPLPKPAKTEGTWQDGFGESDKENEDPERPLVHRRTSNPGLRESGWLRENGKDSGTIRAPLDAAEGMDKARDSRADIELDAVQQLLSLSQGAWR